mmetsp:Transcript_52445/g.145380  ORF Transcript_52445/g.145380 Transcript_52445/m.145380 type:complete len:200 (-) Transcript_52445:42-641(-)
MVGRSGEPSGGSAMAVSSRRTGTDTLAIATLAGSRASTVSRCRTPAGTAIAAVPGSGVTPETTAVSAVLQSELTSGSFISASSWAGNKCTLSMVLSSARSPRAASRSKPGGGATQNGLVFASGAIGGPCTSSHLPRSPLCEGTPPATLGTNFGVERTTLCPAKRALLDTGSVASNRSELPGMAEAPVRVRCPVEPQGMH